MGAMETYSQAEELVVSAVVLKCICGKPESHRGEICPKAKMRDMGVVAHLKPRNFIQKLIGG